MAFHTGISSIPAIFKAGFWDAALLSRNQAIAVKLLRDIYRSPNTSYQPCMAILLSIDAYFGVCMVQITEHGSLRIVVLLVSIIIIYQGVIYHNIEYKMYVFKDVIDKIDKRKSYIEGP